MRRFALAFAFALSGCGSSVHSDLTIDGKPFGPDLCRNGQDEEFFGVDLKHSSGPPTLRLVAHPDKTVSVILFRGDGRPPVKMTGCARLHLDRGENNDSGVYPLSGDATLDCRTDTASVVGTTRFEDCRDEY